jgi:hypothetical protein
MACTSHQLLWNSRNERRELPEATENRLQVQVDQEGVSRRNLQLEDSSGQMRARLCRLQSLAQEQGRIVYRVHQSRCRGRSRFDSDPSKRRTRAQEAKPLHERGDWMECGEKCSRGRDADSRSSRAGNYRKQATTKKRLLDNWSEQPVDKNQVPQVDHVSGWSRGMGNAPIPSPIPPTKAATR